MQTQPVKINEWIQKGLNLYKENFATIFAASLIVALLSTITCGILAGPLTVGLALIILRLIDKQEPKPQVGDVFKGFDLFLHSFLLIIGVGAVSWIGSMILGVVPALGILLGVLFSFTLSAVVMFGIFLVAERRMDAWSAVTKSFDAVKANFWPFLGLYLLTALLSMIGLVLCGIGVLLTGPIMICVLGVAYRQVFTPDQPELAQVAADTSDASADAGSTDAPPAPAPELPPENPPPVA